jgi:hypothetical protein
MSATIARVRALLYLVLHPTRLLALLGAVLGGFQRLHYPKVPIWMRTIYFI